MYLKKLQLNNFKNCAAAEMEFSEKVNCFVGDNGAGKTNILDAIYYLSFCKSYFNQIDQQNIKHDEDFFAVHGEYFNQTNTNDKVSCVQKKAKKKSFKINKKEYSRLADHIGIIPLVMISPYDRDLINDGSELRRKYIDGVISQFDNIYLKKLLAYNKSLLQRNALLKQFAEHHYFEEASLQVWNDKLAELGQHIFEKRKEFLLEFNPQFEDFYRYLSGGKESVEIEIYKEADANIVSVAKRVKEKLYGTPQQQAFVKRMAYLKEHPQAQKQNQSDRQNRQKGLLKKRMTNFLTYSLPGGVHIQTLSGQSIFIDN